VATANVTTEQPYVISLQRELRKLEEHAADVIEMLREYGVQGPHQHIEMAAEGLRGAIRIYTRAVADRTIAVVTPEDARAGRGPELAGFGA